PGQFAQQFPNRQEIGLMRAQIASVVHDRIQYRQSEASGVCWVRGITGSGNIGAGATPAFGDFAQVKLRAQQCLPGAARLEVRRQFLEAGKPDPYPPRRRVESEYL